MYIHDIILKDLLISTMLNFSGFQRLQKPFILTKNLSPLIYIWL